MHGNYTVCARTAPDKYSICLWTRRTRTVPIQPSSNIGHDRRDSPHPYVLHLYSSALFIPQFNTRLLHLRLRLSALTSSANPPNHLRILSFLSPSPSCLTRRDRRTLSGPYHRRTSGPTRNVSNTLLHPHPAASPLAAAPPLRLHWSPCSSSPLPPIHSLRLPTPTPAHHPVPSPFHHSTHRNPRPVNAASPVDAPSHSHHLHARPHLQHLHPASVRLIPSPPATRLTHPSHLPILTGQLSTLRHIHLH